MNDNQGLPVAGYRPQSDEAVAIVNDHKQLEEILLRRLDALRDMRTKAVIETLERPAFDQRWLAIARTHFEEGFMALNRAVFQPTRIKLPEDK